MKISKIEEKKPVNDLLYFTKYKQKKRSKTNVLNYDDILKL